MIEVRPRAKAQKKAVLVTEEVPHVCPCGEDRLLILTWQNKYLCVWCHAQNPPPERENAHTRETIMAVLRVPEPKVAFIPAPAGIHNAVCVDFIELKDVERSYGGKTWKEDQGRFVFQIERRITEADVRASLAGISDPKVVADRMKLVGQRFTIRTFGQKLSMDPKANMRQLIEGWTGRQFKIGDTFDPESLVGEPCFVTVVHKLGGQNGTSTYANVSNIGPVMKDDTGQPFKPVIAPENYVRVQPQAEQATDGAPENDADIPF